MKELKDKYRNLENVHSMRKEMLKEILNHEKKKDKRLILRLKKAHEKYYDLRVKQNKQDIIKK